MRLAGARADGRKAAQGAPKTSEKQRKTGNRPATAQAQRQAALARALEKWAAKKRGGKRGGLVVVPQARQLATRDATGPDALSAMKADMARRKQ